VIKRIKRNLLIAPFLVIIIPALLFTIFSLLKQRPTSPPESQIAGLEEELLDMAADLNGDGNLEFVGLNSDENSSRVSSIVAYSSQGEIIGSTPERMTFPQPAMNSFRVFRLDSEESRDFFSFDFTAGPHQFERMFFELHKDSVLPVCFTEEKKWPGDCLFYMGGPDYLMVEDLDKDGLAEVIGVVDEYPGEGELTEEIASRESGGRGRPVAWGIYSYNSYYLEPQLGENYEKYFSVLKEEYENLMRKSDLSKDSLDYIESTRTFWTKR